MGASQRDTRDDEELLVACGCNLTLVLCVPAKAVGAPYV